jgi:hypothetical protein
MKRAHQDNLILFHRYHFYFRDTRYFFDVGSRRKNFSLIPPTGNTFPRNVISPVMAKFSSPLCKQRN